METASASEEMGRSLILHPEFLTSSLFFNGFGGLANGDGGGVSASGSLIFPVGREYFAPHGASY
jgi:hypothetical protein